MFEEFAPGIVTVSDPRGTTLVTFGFEQMYKVGHTDVRTDFAHRIDQGVDMTILELHSHTDSTMRWTGVCEGDHHPSGQPADDVRADAARTADRQVRGRTAGGPAGRPTGRRDAASPTRGARGGRGTVVGTAPSRTPSPRRSAQARPVSAEGVRACRIESSAPAGVVDDVPAWALLACGVVVGVIVLLAVAFLGGPAYA